MIQPLIYSNGVERNPGPEIQKSQIPSLQWCSCAQLDQSFFVLILDFGNDWDIISLTEAFLRSLINNDKDKICNTGYNLMPVDCPSNTERKVFWRKEWSLSVTRATDYWINIWQKEILFYIYIDICILSWTGSLILKSATKF